MKYKKHRYLFFDVIIAWLIRQFRDLNPKDLAAWLIKTRNKDLKKISGSLTQQVVFNRNDDPAYAEKMEKTRKEVYKQLGRDDLLKK